MAHWRTMAKADFFCAADLWVEKDERYRNAIVKITAVAQGEVVGQKGRKKGMPFLALEDRHGKAARAPLGANPTNCKTITSLLGTPDVKRWVGQWIELVVAKVDSPEGGQVDAIRVSPKLPPNPMVAVSSDPNVGPPEDRS